MNREKETVEAISEPFDTHRKETSNLYLIEKMLYRTGGQGFGQLAPQSGSRWFGIRKHRFRRVHTSPRQALEIVLAHRLHLGWRRPHAAEFQAGAEADRGLAKKRTDRCHRQGAHL